MSKTNSSKQQAAKRDPGSPVTRVNKLLKRAGHAVQLVRGRGYYYLRDTGDGSTVSTMAGLYSTSIYVFWLERTEADFRFARAAVNDILRAAKLATI